MTPSELKAAIETRARGLGFDAFGVAHAEPLVGERERLQEWLGAGRHGTMSYMARLAAERIDPDALVPGARSVLCLAHNYCPDPRSDIGASGAAEIARYARGRDYHRVLRRKLRDIARYIESELPGERARACVDTAPLLEKAWAERAGLGWRGKHTNLVMRSLGSWAFLGEIVTTADLPADDPHLDFCGTCTRCLDACPTGALIRPHEMDARLCISYLTIEHRGPFTPEEGRLIGEHLFGCDICLEVCPWNRFQRPTEETDLMPRAETAGTTLREWADMDGAAYESRLTGSALRRAGSAGLRRNARQILRNQGEGSSLE